MGSTMHFTQVRHLVLSLSSRLYLLCIARKYVIWYSSSPPVSIHCALHASTSSGTFPLSPSLSTMHCTQVRHLVLSLSPRLYLLCISRKWAIWYSSSPPVSIYCALHAST